MVTAKLYVWPLVTETEPVAPAQQPVRIAMRSLCSKMPFWLVSTQMAARSSLLA